MTVTESVEAELAEMGDVGKGPLAATALVLAGKMDSERTSATAASMCAKALADVWRELCALAPPKIEDTELDRRRREREQRLAGLSAAGSAASS